MLLRSIGLGMAVSMLVAAPQVAAAQAASTGRATVDLSRGWHFRFGDAPAGVTGAVFDDKGWQTVALPHTWNRVGSYGAKASPESDTRRGIGWYRLGLDVPKALPGQRRFLQFDGVGELAEIWVNGIRMGEHKGAYARFRFDITDALKPGANLIVVKADNSKPEVGSSTQDVLPLGGDYFVHGGLYRGVSLVTTDSAQIDMLDHGGPGVYIRTPVIAADHADVEILTRLRNIGAKPRKLTLASSILDAAGKTVAMDSAPVALAGAATGEMRRTIVLANPHLWQGRADPYLYQVAVELRDGAQVIDRVVEPLGVRSFVFDPDKGFILNGKPTPLHGVSRHQDRAGKGWALSPEDHAEDMAAVVEIGANTIRQAHYEHAQEWTAAADKAGMVVWSELPYTHESSLTHDAPTAALVDNAKAQLVELIRQNYNHPSVMIWGVGNEIDIGAIVEAQRHMGKGKLAQSLRLLRTLSALAQQEDPGRPTAYADCCDGTFFSMPGMEKLSGATSITAYNRYYGWYYGTPSDMGPSLDKLHAAHPELPIAVSEYGAGGALSQHSDNPEGGPVNSVGRPHPEEYQSWYHEKTWAELKTRPYLEATWLWNMFDFASRREEGDAFDINDKGLIAYDHKTRKDAFYYYKANWSAEPTLYITGRRYVDRAYPVIDVRVYSNAAKAGLTLNGKALGDADCPEHVCVWHDVRLATGPNRVTVQATIGGTTLSDSVIWTAPDATNGLRIMAGTLTGTTTADGLRFGSDNFFTGGEGKALVPFQIAAMGGKKKPLPGTAYPELFEAYREGSFSYRLPLPDGKWKVTLHMFEPDRKRAATRTFDVTANGKTVLKDFNPASAAGGALTAVTREFPVKVKGGKLELAFAAKGGEAIVSAITVSR